MDNPDAVLLEEEWESMEELNYHIRSKEYQIILSLMELSEETPEIQLNTISKTEGIEAIKAVRL